MITLVKSTALLYTEMIDPDTTANIAVIILLFIVCYFILVL